MIVGNFKRENSRFTVNGISPAVVLSHSFSSLQSGIFFCWRTSYSWIKQSPTSRFEEGSQSCKHLPFLLQFGRSSLSLYWRSKTDFASWRKIGTLDCAILQIKTVVTSLFLKNIIGCLNELNTNEFDAICTTSWRWAANSQRSRC